MRTPSRGQQEKKSFQKERMGKKSMSTQRKRAQIERYSGFSAPGRTRSGAPPRRCGACTITGQETGTQTGFGSTTGSAICLRNRAKLTDSDRLKGDDEDFEGSVRSRLYHQINTPFEQDELRPSIPCLTSACRILIRKKELAIRMDSSFDWLRGNAIFI